MYNFRSDLIPKPAQPINDHCFAKNQLFYEALLFLFVDNRDVINEQEI